MTLGLLGNKIGMTQIFDSNNNVIPVTIVRVGPCFITQIKTEDTDGYNAVQLSYGSSSSKICKNPQRGHFSKIGLSPLRHSCEYKVLDPSNYELGQKITSDIFVTGQKIQVTGQSIGKGFAGLQKRHHFSRGPMTHGSKNHRAPGSIGAGTTPGRVFVGKKMAGHLGHKKVTISNLEVIKVDSDQNFIVIKGSVPGKTGNLVSIK